MQRKETQTDLFEAMAAADRTKPEQLSRVTDPESSYAAAARAVDSGLVGSHEARILAGCRKWPGLTANELAARIGLTGVQVNRRLQKMKERGLIKRQDHGKELTIYPGG